MNTWSPAAQKAATAARHRQDSYNPTLARTSASLILQRPHRGSHGGQADFAAFVARELPGWRFDHKRNWWSAPLTEENYLACIKANVCAGEIMINRSDGVHAWLKSENEKRLQKLEKEMEG